MKKIRVGSYVVSVQDTQTKRFKTYYRASQASKDRLHKMLSHLPGVSGESYMLSDNPFVMFGLYLSQECYERKAQSINKGDIFVINGLGFEVIKLNPKNIKVRRVGMTQWSKDMSQRYTTYTRQEILDRGHPVSRLECVVLLKTMCLIAKKEG